MIDTRLGKRLPQTISLSIADDTAAAGCLRGIAIISNRRRRRSDPMRNIS
jgi:hypothetical protein